MYKLMTKWKEEGKAILLISEELSELIGMCDNLMILKEGKVAKVFPRSKTLTDSKVINYII